MRNNFPKRPSGAPLHTLSKFLDVQVGFVTPSFDAVYCYICGRRRVAVDRYRMICLVLVCVHHAMLLHSMSDYSRFDLLDIIPNWLYCIFLSSICNHAFLYFTCVNCYAPPPLRKRMAYCVAHVRRSVGLYVGLPRHCETDNSRTLCPRSFKLGR